MNFKRWVRRSKLRGKTSVRAKIQHLFLLSTQI